MEQQEQLIDDLETALTGLAKLIKALRFYPPGHPSLQGAVKEANTAFAPLLAQPGQRAFNVTQSGFALDRTPIAPNNPILQDLARQLVARRVRQLLFLPELPDRELLAFVRLLARPPEELYQQGGLPELLQQQRVGAIWINETDLEQALLRRLELEEAAAAEEAGAAADPPREEPPATAQEPAIRLQLRQLLEQLENELDDAEHARRLEQLQQLAPAFLEQTGILGALRLFPLLLQQHGDPRRSSVQRQAAGGTLDLLLSRERIELLIDAVEESSLKPPQRRRLLKLLVELELRIAPQLLSRLTQEEDAQVRRHLTAILSRMGDAILELLRESLQDARWFVVRNGITVLGDMRRPTSIPLLEPLVTHPDQRVRRALIRALTMIGGSQTVPLLLRLISDPAHALHRPAVMALGAIRDAEAVAPLLQIVMRPDLLGRATELKLDSIRALAMIGSPAVVSPLLALAKRPNLLRRSRLEAQRAEALLALGQLGDASLLPTLQQLSQGRPGEVGRAAEQALNQLQKRLNDSATA